MVSFMSFAIKRFGEMVYKGFLDELLVLGKDSVFCR